MHLGLSFPLFTFTKTNNYMDFVSVLKRKDKGIET